MKTLTALKSLCLLSFVSIFLHSCSNDDDNNDQITIDPSKFTIVENAIATPSLSLLVEALQAADGNLVNVLSGTGPFTVLAPTNDAFQDLLDSNSNWNTINDIDTAVLQQVLLNHVISGDVKSTDLTSLGSGYTKTNADGADGNKLSLYFSTSNGVMFNGISTVVSGGADLISSNGTVHVVDKVITLPTVVDHAIANPEFGSLVSALGAADGDLVSVLSGNGPFTVLAPDNNAFTSFLNGAALADVDTSMLSQILLNHVMSGTTLSTDLINLGTGYSNTSATGAGGNAMSIYINATDGVMFNGISTVQVADIVATNGVIHAINNVIDLPNVVDFALADPEFSTLVTALTRDDLTTNFVQVLSTEDGTSPAPFTVFAPTNMAFANLLNELNTTLADIDEPTLKATLNHHVVGGLNVVSTDLTDNFTVPTLGGNITANVTGGATLTDTNNRVSNIIAVDVQASNGVIHAIDKVVLPSLQ
ncbi:hypothetical protein GCM10022291_34100 [Postechiella marina]|uniref:FAS1 domain-containing protein n=1 Tax=Postechiella marina TaxID=943941 RepID=A0ABP8CIE8_9FLAO